jgi:hypothetical protein
MASRLSRTNFNALSRTAVGIARLGVPSAFVDNDPALPLVAALLLLPLVAATFPFEPSLLAEPDSAAFVSASLSLLDDDVASAAVAAAVSRRTSSSTRRMSVGNVVTSPDRSKESACACIIDGQLVGCASREWRNWSWILFGKAKVSQLELYESIASCPPKA